MQAGLVRAVLPPSVGSNKKAEHKAGTTAGWEFPLCKRMPVELFPFWVV